MNLSWFTDSDLLQSGSWVLVFILLLSTVMWALILERYWFFNRQLAGLVEETVAHWRELAGAAGIKSRRRLRAGLTSGFHSRLARGLGPILVLAAILPMLGLLGTVIGMIKTFEVMTIFGSGNVRCMAEGISQALITTMAGLVTALFGMFFADQIEQRVKFETEHLNEYLSISEKDHD